MLPPAAALIESGAEDDVGLLQRAGLAEASCLLALADSDLDNLRVAVTAHEAAPHVPVVLRAFDPALADQLEQGLNIRRAYSVSALAAPAFIAAACGDEVLETLRLGDGEVPICRLTVRAGSPLAGQTPSEVETRLRCSVVARLRSGGWQPVGGEDGTALAVGDSVLVGGPLSSVLRALCLNVGWLPARRRSAHPGFSKHPGSQARPSPQRGEQSLPARRPTRLPAVAAALLAVIVVAVAVFAHALHLHWVDAVYFVITTATTTGYGDISLKDSPDWLKMFGCVVMLSGGALLGILFSYLAALATAERLEETMGRRAGRMRGHIVLAGLGNLGYRITRLLSELGLSVVALELTPDSRFSDAVRPRVPVLTGDARLRENLDRASLRQAVALIACTDDDMANIQACLHARRMNPTAATVARIFDDALADRLSNAFTIGRALSASQCAVSAFVGAATDERALRPLQLGALSLIACRCTVGPDLTAETIADWRLRGVCVLAFRTSAGAVQPPSELPALLSGGDELILCGPAAVILELTSLT